MPTWRERRESRKEIRSANQQTSIKGQYNQMMNQMPSVLKNNPFSKPTPLKVSKPPEGAISSFMNYQQSPSMQAARDTIQFDKFVKWSESKKILADETSRVMTVRNKLGDLANKAGSEMMSAKELGFSDAQINYLDYQGGASGRSACNSYSCRMMNLAGVTTSKFGDPVDRGFMDKEGRWGKHKILEPGSPMGIVPGNVNFDKHAIDLGWEIQPKYTIADQKGDLMRAGYYSDWSSTPVTHHSAISAGKLEGGGANVVYNTGNILKGVKYGHDYYTNPARYTGKSSEIGVMRYVGDIPEYTKQFKTLGGNLNIPELPKIRAAKINIESTKPESLTYEPTQEEMLSALSYGQKNPKRYSKKLKRQANKFTL